MCLKVLGEDGTVAPVSRCLLIVTRFDKTNRSHSTNLYLQPDLCNPTLAYIKAMLEVDCLMGEPA
ncbi:hypothetical protein BofuT4_uP084950.1 [Botrytis cinerea T4]|uniref:Uncharacterized protein n=1 Tax=Botryotinia fuckeliana (strain T4) TaxID=999810 RepID=G2YHE6_BOTF4|nr:hypothetical protein BofuT4_uP084950.1 [Botrytis cinerea T4]